MRSAINAAAPVVFQLVMLWQTAMRAESLAERTIRDRGQLVTRLAVEIGCEPQDIGTEHVVTYLARPTSTGTRQTYHSGLRSWFRWLLLTGRRADDPMAFIPAPKTRQRSPRPITNEQLRRVLAVDMHSRTRTMILLATYQGLRVSEIARVRGVDLDLHDETLRVIGKGGVDALLPLHPVLAREAAQYGPGWWFPQHVPNRHSKQGGPILGNSVSGMIGAVMKRAGVRATPHALRHWYGSTLLAQGVDTRVTQELMRHSSIATTQRYLAVNDTQRRDGLMRLPEMGETA